MLSKIGQICRENVKLCHDVEYILIDDFFDPVLFDKSHNEFFLPNYTITDNSLEHHFSLSYHPLMGILRDNEKLILTHEAENREIFAKGCINLIEKIKCKKTGLFDFI